jgi:hypothetical protein
MSSKFSSRERLLAAIDCKKPDHVPLAFMIFSALKERIREELGVYDPVEFIETQLALGLDTFVDLRHFSLENKQIGHSDASGFPVKFDGRVKTREWLENNNGKKYPVLKKTYDTPGGELSVHVNQTDDWPYTEISVGVCRVPFMDDYLAPRCTKYLIQKKNDLKALQYLLSPPTDEDLKSCREAWDLGKLLAKEHNLLLAGGWGVGSDALAWFCGLENAVYMALEEPDFFRELLQMIDGWNRPRMEAYLDYGIDLFIRRAWYEGTDFWSPEIFRTFFYPIIKEEVKICHEAGVKYGYILTSGSMPLHEMLIELGIDVLIGADPVQGKGTDLIKMKSQLKDKICIWGGVNGFVTVEEGAPEQIENAVKFAMETLGPDGFILSPVDNIRDPSDRVWPKVIKLIEAWNSYI